ncbi:MAG: protein phosphatase 2C domain-containing protein [Pseudomonadota bacterium]
MQVDTLPLVSVGSATLRGRTHRHNDDSACVLDARVAEVVQLRRGTLFAVCDGVSTVPAGGWAATLTCERLTSFFDADVAPSQEGLKQLVNEIDWELRGRGEGQAACTLSALWLADRSAYIINVGDSQVFRVRHGAIQPLTEGRGRGVGLGVFMGMGPALNERSQSWHDTLFAGDLFFLVTDGVTSVVSSEELLDAWWKSGGDPQPCAEAVVDLVAQRRGADDATVVVVDVLSLESDSHA